MAIGIREEGWFKQVFGFQPSLWSTKRKTLEQVLVWDLIKKAEEVCEAKKTAMQAFLGERRQTATLLDLDEFDRLNEEYTDAWNRVRKMRELARQFKFNVHQDPK